MKKKSLLTLLAALICAANLWADVAINGKLSGAFSVSATKQVYFSQGNLQYNSDEQKWQFAAHQYDYIGNTTGNTTITVDGKANNTGITDLFGWVGASSSFTGLAQYGISSSQTTNNTNGYGNNASEALKSDWSTLMGAGWFTMSCNEWRYLFNTRSCASVNGTVNARYTQATINTDGTSVNGIILFPDDFDFAKTSGVTAWGTINGGHVWGTKLTTAQWTSFEENGCVFLPAAGYSYGTSVGDVSAEGRYWSSSPKTTSVHSAYNVIFNDYGDLYPEGSSARYYGYSVRLVSETAPSMTDLPLTFEAMEAGATVTYTQPSTIPIQYSTDGINWSDYSDPITLAAVGDKVSFRGNNSCYDGARFECTKDCYIYGNIMSLVDATNYATATELTGLNTFYELFKNNTHIINHPTKDLVLPATTLAWFCYQSMFYGCTGLTSAPALPATTLDYGCYLAMFSGCTGLTSAPELPATILPSGCYLEMFKGCTGLMSAPELPATTLSNQCYEKMFNGCTGLTSAPELPATTLAGSCYSNMFSGCTGLTSAPALPATTLASGCYSQMFKNCTGLTSAPALPATTLVMSCYSNMFSGCTGLTSAPELPATNLMDYCYKRMFEGCTNLSSVTCYATSTATNATEDWLNGVAATGTFYGPKNSVFASEERGPNAIPVGWTFTPFQSSLTTAPTAVEGLEYTGAAQALLNNDGVAEGGTLNYSLDNTNWSEAIPTATNAGDYTVYYKVVGDASHADFIPSPNEIAVSIAAPSAVALTANPDPDPLHAGDYYSTFYHSAVAYELSAGVEAYVAELSDDALILTKIAEGGQVIPMNNAVILKANSGSITLTPSDATPVTFTATNNLHGVDAPSAAPANCYVLSGHSSDNSVTGVGFYQYNGTLKAHRAYAVISGGAAYAPKKLRFVFNATTDVESIQPSEVRSQKVIENGVLYIIKNGVRYNAQGQVIK